MKYITLFALAILLSCNGQKQNPESQHQHTNALINETSPYLLQHAHNPVDWHAWNDETLEKAKSENKLMLISVGYSACHWCHVMEDECFEDSLVAEVMNKNFINIKVDREERPDIDKAYMSAVQLMNNGAGGWPLNAITLPDGKPVWGAGTYIPKNQWTNILTKIAELYNEDPDKLHQQANNVEQGIKSMSLVSLNTEAPVFENELVEQAVKNWSKNFDPKYGGINPAPKFMMPNNYRFLMRYAFQHDDKDLLNFVNYTLKKIAYGGVFDQLGGGFSRYSVDEKWHVPHFEKMLYDNAQLVSLYADAYLLTKDDLYKSIVEETLNYVKNEMTTAEGAFYSSLDADSKTPEGELEEGAFYVWKKDTLRTILKDDFAIFSDYYSINNYGLWEHGNYVLIRKDDDADIIKKHKLSQTDLDQKKIAWKSSLLEVRNNRAKPRLDDKALASWNGLMLQGYIDAYRVFQNETYLDAALKNANFIINKMLRTDGGLNHTYKNGESKINGYLEDYVTVIQAFISLYENTLDEKWLNTANNLANYVFIHFHDDSSNMFYYTSDEDNALVARNIEFYDQVIPSGNSIMAKNLFKLAHYYDNEHFRDTAIAMLNNVKPNITDYPSSFSNWLDLMLNYTNPYYEVAIVGKDVKQKLNELNKEYLPNKLIAGSASENNMPLLKSRYNPDNTLIYVCVNKACKLPVSETDKAIKFLKE